MTELTLFLSSFLLVFALGLQSLNVNGGHYAAAFFTSFLIGAGNLIVLKLAPNAGPTEMLAYLAGGPLGIICSMVFHAYAKRIIRWLRAQPRRTRTCAPTIRRTDFPLWEPRKPNPQPKPQPRTRP